MEKAKQIADMLSSVKTELPTSSEPNHPDEADVAERAHELYESRGRIEGGALDDWAQAKRDLKEQ